MVVVDDDMFELVLFLQFLLEVVSLFLKSLQVRFEQVHIMFHIVWNNRTFQNYLGYKEAIHQEKQNFLWRAVVVEVDIQHRCDRLDSLGEWYDFLVLFRGNVGAMFVVPLL